MVKLDPSSSAPVVENEPAAELTGEAGGEGTGEAGDEGGEGSEAGAPPAPPKRKALLVAPGRAVYTLRGLKEEGAELLEDDFVSAKEDVAALITSGHAVEAMI